MLNQTIGLNDFAVLVNGVVFEENINQERAFEILQNNKDSILQVWGYNEKTDTVEWINI